MCKVDVMIVCAHVATPKNMHTNQHQHQISSQRTLASPTMQSFRRQLIPESWSREGDRREQRSSAWVPSALCCHTPVTMDKF
jgi:hypothetical protein